LPALAGPRAKRGVEELVAQGHLVDVGAVGGARFVLHHPATYRRVEREGDRERKREREERERERREEIRGVKRDVRDVLPITNSNCPFL
jgi:hypothetical protein